MSREVSVASTCLGRAAGFFLGPFLDFLHPGVKRLGELGVDGVARPRGDDVRLERQAEQHQVADDVEDLVADELVLEAQRLLRDDLVALDDDGVVETAALDLAQLDELLDVLVDREGAGGGHLRDVGVGIDREREVLRMDAAVVGRGAGNLQAVGRQRDDRGAAARHGDRLVEHKVLPFRLLFDRLGLQDEIHERLGRAVHDGRLARVHLHQHVVDAAAVAGR